MNRPRIAAAMSGGVDSSLAAALLLQRGYDVVGLTMQIWPRDPDGDIPPGARACCGLDALDSARRVARALGIPHYTLNLRRPFAHLVIDPFCDDYARGLTPNPCIRCNSLIKFGPLLRRAREIGAAKLATGHYARVSYHEPTRRWLLRRGVDTSKDQSYTLYGLTQEQLARAFFPLGGLTKSRARQRAADLGLPAADRPESQEICFISGRGYHSYLRRRRPEVARPGPIVDTQGRQLGRHRGIAFYTIGQRQGLRVAHREPLYVLAIDVENNRLIAGPKSDLKAGGLIMRAVNYSSLDRLPENGADLRARIRSAGPLAKCTARPDGRRVKLTFARPQLAVAPGQAAVCYRGAAVAFGGTIASPL